MESGREKGLLYHVYESKSIIIYAITELQKIHRPLGRSNVRTLYNLLQKAFPEDMESK